MRPCVYHTTYHQDCRPCRLASESHSYYRNEDDDSSSIVNAVIATEVASEVFSSSDPTPSFDSYPSYDSNPDTSSFDSGLGGDSGGGGPVEISNIKGRSA